MNKIRCPACRGAKKVPKLGGMIGECNACKGVGQINEDDKPKPVIVEPPLCEADIIIQVANVSPIIVDPLAPIEVQVTCNDEPMVRIDPKKAIYRKKKA